MGFTNYNRYHNLTDADCYQPPYFVNTYTHGIGFFDIDKFYRIIVSSRSYARAKEQILKNFNEMNEPPSRKDLVQPIRTCIYCLSSSNKLPIMNQTLFNKMVEDIIMNDDDLCNIYVLMEI